MVILIKMKIAISIPDPLFDAAEDVADRLGVSRSQLYAKALAEYVAKHRDDQVTEALNRVYAKYSSTLDPVLAAMQSLSLPKEEW
jgi:metal-responsive CopG/Arc/MetJ family transcriptional regulator